MLSLEFQPSLFHKQSLFAGVAHDPPISSLCKLLRASSSTRITQMSLLLPDTFDFAAGYPYSGWQLSKFKCDREINNVSNFHQSYQWNFCKKKMESKDHKMILMAIF